jgi:hypothetical protein
VSKALLAVLGGKNRKVLLEEQPHLLGILGFGLLNEFREGVCLRYWAFFVQR